MFERTYVGNFHKKKQKILSPLLWGPGAPEKTLKQLFLNFRVHFTGKRHIVDFFGLQIQIQHTRIREEKLLRGPGINVA